MQQLMLIQIAARKGLFAFILSMLCFALTPAAMADSNLFGFIDKAGKFVIKPQYTEVDHFSEGLAPVMIKGKWGYIDKSGKIVIVPKFLRAKPFSEGLATVEVDDKFGYIDRTGSFVLPAKFDNARSFFEGLALAGVGDNGGFIDKTGKIVLRRTEPIRGWYFSYFAGDFSQGMTVVQADRKFGYMDKYGKLAVKRQFVDAKDFHEGLAAVKTAKWGFIDKAGRFVVSPQFDRVGSFTEGRALVIKGTNCGFIDKTGKMVAKLVPKIGNDQGDLFFVGGFFDGLAIAEPATLNHLRGYIDATGEFVIEPQFIEAYDFHEGLAAVSKR